MDKIVGILSLQGNFSEHQQILNELHIKNKLIKSKDDFADIDGLIIPGGESTAMTILIKEQELLEELYKCIIIDKKPVMGTCAGTIILSNLLPMLIGIERNSYGSHTQSFMTILPLEHIGKFNCIFIRAPKIIYIKKGNVLGYHNNNPILAQIDNILLCTFHPELENKKIHKYFFIHCHQFA